MAIKKENGFNIVELMIVVVAISVIAAIAVPIYKNYTIRTNRTNVQTAMVQIAQKLEAYKLANNNYSGAALTNTAIYGGTVYPQRGTVTYNLSLTVSTTGWTLTATATGKQAGNGDVLLNDQGQKCWTKGTTCTLSATTNWEGK